MSGLKELRVRQLDSRLADLGSCRAQMAPGVGWIRTIRESLGMSIRQLAERSGLSKTSVASIERNEKARTVRLESLDRLAQAMECEVLYAVVPRTSLDQIIADRACEMAERMVGAVSDSMHLEMQGTSVSEKERLIEELAKDLRRDFRKLWQ